MMKKITSIILAFAVSAVVFAQTEGSTESSSSSINMVSKRGVNILPEAGEIALGMNAAPFLSYIGGFFSNAGGGAPSVNYAPSIANTNSIYVKYMLADDAAIRTNFQFAYGNNTTFYEVDKSNLMPDLMRPEYVQDEVNTHTHNFLLGLGYEMRRGKGRVQGYYGGQVLFGKTGSTTDYIYGNPINADFNTPSIHNAYNGATRIIKDEISNGLTFGIRPFIGVEYFFAAKASIGGEFGYGFLFNKNINRTRTYEYWDAGSNSVETMQTKNTFQGIKNYTLGADNLFGAINLMFYF